MIPLTALCKQLIAWAYATYVEEAPKRRIKQKQRELNRLILQIDIAAGRARRTPDGGIIGQANMPTSTRRYLDKAFQIYGTVTGRIPSLKGSFQVAQSCKTYPKLPATPTKQLAKSANFANMYGLSPKGIRALYADRPTNEGDADRAFRMARYCAYSDDEELLDDAIIMLKRYFPLEALAVEMG